MQIQVEKLSFHTDEKLQLVNITSHVQEFVRRSSIKDGLLGLFSQHTTAVLIVNEFQDALLDDIRGFLKRIVNDELFYKHNSPEFSDCDRHNATSHLRSLLFSHSVLLPIASRELILGPFQSVILAELDGPRVRTLKVQLIGE